MSGIDRFSKQQFEDALPKGKVTGTSLWRCAGLVDGEYVYLIPVLRKGDNPDNANVMIEVRSSVDVSGFAADCGENSIRAFLTWFDPTSKRWLPLGSKVVRWTTRMPGWDKRLEEVLRTLYSWRLKAGDCPTCKHPKGIYKVTKADSPNKGRVFAKCHDHNGWTWLDDRPFENNK